MPTEAVVIPRVLRIPVSVCRLTEGPTPVAVAIKVGDPNPRRARGSHRQIIDERVFGVTDYNSICKNQMLIVADYKMLIVGCKY